MLCFHMFLIFTAFLQFIYWLGDITDVGMMMMQSGMVKQSVDFTSSIKAFDGTKIDKHKNAFIMRTILFLMKSFSFYRPLSTYFLIQSQPKTKKITNHQNQMLNVFYAKSYFKSQFMLIAVEILLFFNLCWKLLRMELRRWKFSAQITKNKN